MCPVSPGCTLVSSFSFAMKRVGIVGLLHESNTFVAGRTVRSDFEADLLLRGEPIRAAMIDAPHEVGGFFQGLAEAGIEAVPIFLARALPYGTIEAGTFMALVEELLESVHAVGELDGILAAPHGATVAENHPDADGYWLERLRKELGAGFPIVATIDPHANLSQRMVDATDVLIAYTTNPHLDQRETGVKAASLLSRMLEGSVVPVQKAVFPELAINIQTQNTSEEPLRSFYSFASECCDVEGVLSHSIVLGFPYADVPEMGSSVLVVTDGNPELAAKLSANLANGMDARKEFYEPGFLSISSAIARVCESEQAPVVLLDMGDNVGGGSPADSTAIPHEWLKCGDGAGAVVLFDPASVEKAVEVGEGGVSHFSMGDPSHPVKAECVVRSLHDGKFHESEARHGGFSSFDQGKTAILETSDGRLTMMATSRRMAPFSLSQLTAFGLDPGDYRMIVAKGVIAPMAAYQPVAKGGFLHVDSPGVTRANMRKLDYRNRRRPMFPFE